FPLAFDVVEPTIGGDPKQPRARLFGWGHAGPEDDESPNQRVLHQVLRVPGGARQEAAVAIQVGPQGLEFFGEPAPGLADGQVQRGFRPGIFVLSHASWTIDALKRIRRSMKKLRGVLRTTPETRQGTD